MVAIMVIVFAAGFGELLVIHSMGMEMSTFLFNWYSLGADAAWRKTNTEVEVLVGASNKTPVLYYLI